jgi:hypothetical protein
MRSADAARYSFTRVTGTVRSGATRRRDVDAIDAL